MPTNIYRARRPAVAALLVIPAVGVGCCWSGRWPSPASASRSTSAASSPARWRWPRCRCWSPGLYGLITGAAHGAEQWGFRVWARPPLAYLLVGIAFAVAAGLAIT